MAGSPKKKSVKTSSGKKVKLSRKSSPAKKKTSVIKALKDEDKLTFALRAARMGIWDWDLVNNKIEWSDEVYEIFGLKIGEFNGTAESYRRIIHPEDQERVSNAIELSIKHVKNYYVDHRIVLPDNSIRWIEGVGKVFVDGKGNSIRMTGTVRDATEKKVTEQEKEDWKTKFSHIANSSGIVIYDYSIPTGKIIWSGNTLDVLGYEPSSMGDIVQWEKLIHPADKGEAFEKLEAAQAILAPYDVKYRFKKNDGSYCRMHDRGFFIPGADRKATRMLGMMQDISMFEETALALKESESRFEKLVFDIDIGVLLQSPAGEILLSNQTALTLLGISEEHLLEKTLSDPAWNVIHENGSLFEKHERPICLATATLKPVCDVIMGVHRPDINDRTWLLVNATPILDGQSNLLHVICTFTNITDRKKIEEELKESEQRFRILQQASFGGIAIHDKGLIIDCNQGLSDLTRYSREELVGMNGLLLIAPEYRDMIKEKIISGYEKPYDAEGIRKDGSRFMLDIQAKNIPYKGMQVRVTEFRDITIRKVAEENLFEQNTKLVAITEDLKRKNEQLEEFTQIVSHNLRSPVGNIITLSGFLEGPVTDDEKKQYLHLLKESGIITLTMLNDLNEVLKIKQNKNIERSDLLFEQVLLQVKSMLSTKIAETSAIINYDFSHAPTLLYPGIYLESIVLNLLSNALKYHRVDTPLVINLKTYKTNGHTMMEVTDNGLGINLQKYGHHVFKMRKTFHKHPESRGIGLFMIKNQIEAMGGEISLSSKVNEGTTFYINFNKHH